MPIPQHLSKSNEQGTPLNIVTSVKKVMSDLDLDPASNLMFNQDIKAKKIYTKAENGLLYPWYGNVFVNPPGGKIQGTNSSYQNVFFKKSLAEFNLGNVKNLIFLSFNSNLLFMNLEAFDHMVCICSERICFDKIVDGERVTQEQPTHHNAIIFLSRYHGMHAKFATEFLQYGPIVTKMFE